MGDIWSFLLQTLTACGAAALLLCIKALFRDKLSPRWHFAAWSVLALILLLPAGRGGRYVLVNWPFLVEQLRSALTGEYGALAHVSAPVPLPSLTLPRTPAEWLFALYVLGAVFLLARYVFAYVRLRRTLRRGRPAPEEKIRAVADRYGLPACPAVEVEGLPTAFICGVFRPVLALPAGEEIDGKVLLHELMHLKHRDTLWGLVIALFRCIHWCDPLLWYCADQAGNDLESLCDQRVLERLEGEERRDYGKILLKMADEGYARVPGTSSLANGGKNIRRRIQAIARFKLYPRGMALVSACILLVLAVPLAAGTQAGVPDLNGLSGMAAARTAWCTTAAGAFDTYVKSIATGRFAYRAMCAPLLEQNALVEDYRAASAQGHWEWIDLDIDSSAGYQIYSLVPAGEDAWEGTLVMELRHAPMDVEWDGTTHSRWVAVQPLRAEKEGERWVILPLDELRLTQRDQRDGGDLNLPARTFQAQVEDFTLLLQHQTYVTVSSDAPLTPSPHAVFNWAYAGCTIRARYTGTAEDWEQYESIAVAYAPMQKGQERPQLRTLENGTWYINGGTSGESHGSTRLDNFCWDDVIWIPSGGSGIQDNKGVGPYLPPDAYAVDLYLNGRLAAQLTLELTEGGAWIYG